MTGNAMDIKRINIRNFEEFVNENYSSGEFQRFYMLVKTPFPRVHGSPTGQMIADIRDALFEQVPINKYNYKKKFRSNVPILNFTDENEIIDLMVKEKVIKKSSLYNDPKSSHQVSNKVIFHHLFKHCNYVPKTVFSMIDAKEGLEFPIVAKPSSGKSAKGIKKFDTLEDFEVSSDSFDVYSEAIDIVKEYRSFCFKDSIIDLNERVKMKGSKDFLKDTNTTTDFIYKKIDLDKYDNLKALEKLIEECKKVVKLDFFSVDFAEDRSGKLWLIEMNSRTGMGIDKMTKLYRAIYEDFYKKKVDEKVEKKLVNLDQAWEKVYKKEKNTSVNECLVVGGKLENKMFLFKNRDRSFTPDSRVVVENISNVEVVYYTDQTGWIEGMNEYGVGFVFSALTEKEYKGYDPSYTVTDEPKNDNLFKRFAEGIKKILTSKTAEEAIDKILVSEKPGNFLVGDKECIIELEVFKGKHKKKRSKLEDFIVKSNHGELIPDAGHQPNGESVKRASSQIRQYQAIVQLHGVTSISDIPTRMKFQAFDSDSSLNVYRTDVEEHTISQCLMNLTDLKFYFFHDSYTADSVKLEEKSPAKKLKVHIVKS